VIDDGQPSLNDSETITITVEMSPDVDVFVSEEGSDETGDGMERNPWLTIQFAIDSVQGTAFVPITIHIGPGTFEESIEMDPFESLVGAGRHHTAIVSDQSPLIRAGAETSISEIEVRTSLVFGEFVCIQATNTEVDVLNCTLDGGDNPLSAGLVISGINSDDSVITGNVFQSLAWGIIARDTAANITENHFRKCIFGVQIRFREESSSLAQLTADETRLPLLGDEFMEESGQNTFRDFRPGGFFVENLNDAPALAQVNDWGVYTAQGIAQSVVNVIFEPFLGGPIPGVVEGTCTNAETGSVVPGTEVVFSAGSTTITATTDEEGWYQIPILEGTYKAIARAGLLESEAVVVVEILPGQNTRQDFKLGPGQIPYGPQAAMVEGINLNLLPLRSFRDGRLARSVAGEGMLRAYYGKETEDLLVRTLDDSRKAKLAQGAVYPSALFVLSALSNLDAVFCVVLPVFLMVGWGMIRRQTKIGRH